MFCLIITHDRRFVTTLTALTVIHSCIPPLYCFPRIVESESKSVWTGNFLATCAVDGVESEELVQTLPMESVSLQCCTILENQHFDTVTSPFVTPLYDH